ncbi:MAG: hypothetical protein AAB608_02615 [Patescibacteria group bacterium]
MSLKRLAFTREDDPTIFTTVFTDDTSLMENATRVRHVHQLLNSALALVGAHLRLVGVNALGGKEILFPPKGPSFEALRALDEESMAASRGPLQPCEYRFVFETTSQQREFRDPLIF